MRLNPVLPLSQWSPSAKTAVLLHPQGERAFSELTEQAACDLLIGPEGGWDDHERLRLQQLGAIAYRLGPRTLRTETAAITACALLQHHCGDLS